MEELLDKVKELSDKYIDNEYVYSRLKHQILTILPNMLEQTTAELKIREERKKDLEKGSTEFVERFLNRNSFFYASTSQTFVYYDGKDFSLYSEDDILYEILQSLRKEGSLMPWKHKIKVHVMKRIRESPLQNCIPESETIQQVVNCLYPNVFSQRQYAKYFLTALGDAILRRNEGLIYVTTSQVKYLAKDIARLATSLFGQNSIASTFKSRFYDHTFDQCRLIKANAGCVKLIEQDNIRQNVLNLLCVACHYSDRYEGADGYIKTGADTILSDHAMFLVGKNCEEIVKIFTKSFIQNIAGQSISSKSMLWIWREYLRTQNLPTVMFQNQFKQIIQCLLPYDAEFDSFPNCTSPLLPSAVAFEEFWKNEIICDDDHDEHLEVEELLVLMRSKNKKQLGGLDSTDVLHLINHFYPEVVVEDEKFICSTYCKFWQKQNIVKDFLEVYRSLSPSNNVVSVPVKTVYSAYTSRSPIGMPRVGKKQFKNYVKKEIGEFMDDDGCILKAWFANSNLSD